MNVFTNEEFYQAQARRSRLFRTLGLASIILSFILSLLTGINPYLVCAAYPFLLGGLPLWTIGRSTERRLKTVPRPDKVMNEELKGLSNKYSLHHYPTLEGTLVKHLLVMPGGLLVMESRENPGPVSCVAGNNGDKWGAKSGLLERFSGLNPAIGNPTTDLEASIKSASDLLGKIGKTAVPVMGLVVFTRNPELTVDGCTYAALPIDELKDTVRDLQFELGSDKSEGAGVASILTTDDRRKLNSLLQPARPPAPATPAPAAKRTTEEKR